MSYRATDVTLLARRCFYALTMPILMPLMPPCRILYAFRRLRYAATFEYHAAIDFAAADMLLLLTLPRFSPLPLMLSLLITPPLLYMMICHATLLI